MNIYYDYEGIIGKPQQAHLRNTLEEIFELARAIRSQLGKQGYLLDKYLHDLLNAINSKLAYEAADSGFQLSGELLHLCNKLTRGEPVEKEHPLYESVKEYIDTHPLPYQEHVTKVNLYCIGLADTFLGYAIPAFTDEGTEAIRREVDMIALHDRYRKISSILGNEDQMEKLNLLIRQRFQVTTAMAGFLQGVTNSLLYALTERDTETNKTVLQLWLDGPEKLIIDGGSSHET